MSNYTTTVDNNNLSLTIDKQEHTLSLSRTGGQGSKGDSVSDISLNSSGEMIFTISNSAGDVVSTSNLGVLDVSTTLGGLQNVDTTGITDGQVLQYDLATTDYVPHTLTTSSMTDIDNTGKTDGAVLLFDSASNKYKATTQLNNENTFMIGGSF
jgi:hypothetical protein